MNIIRTILVLACIALAPAVFATTVSSDITTDTTWNNAGSPYQLNAATIKVRNGATLTIDSSGGNVEIQFNASGYDFQIGNGSGDVGYLHLDASSGTIKFRLRQNCNVVVNAYGQILSTDSTATTNIENYGLFSPSFHDWGALDFEASQTYQSDIKNLSLDGGGYDGKDGALVVRDNATYPPKLEDLTFNNCNVSAIRFDGNGIDTLQQDFLKTPLTVTNTDYVFYLNSVTSTKSIRFPDPDSPDVPKIKLSGTCTVGDSSNVSHWRFDDGYIFDCIASSKIDVVRGSVWGNEESRPVFQSISATPGYTDWNGVWDFSTSNSNVFGPNIGSIGHIEVKDATSGVAFRKLSVSFADVVWRLSGISAVHCSTGINVGSASGTIVIEDCEFGGDDSQDRCYSQNLWSVSGSTYLYDSILWGLATNSPSAVWTSGTYGFDAHVRGCRIVGPANMGLQFNSVSGTKSGTALVERTLIGDSINIAVKVNQSASYSPARSLTMRNCSLSGVTEGLLLDIDSASVTTVLVEDCSFADGGTYGIRGEEVRSASSVTVRRTAIYEHTLWCILKQRDQ